MMFMFRQIGNVCVCGSILPFDSAVAFDVAAVTVVAVSVIDCISISIVVAMVFLWVQAPDLNET